MKFFAFSQCFRQDIATLPQRARRRIYGLRAVSSKQYLAENNFFDSLKGAEPLYSFLPKGGRMAQAAPLRSRVGQIAAANKIILIFINVREKFHFFAAAVGMAETGTAIRSK